MAVLIASGLRKEINGTPLFDGVSLTVNRRDRVALAGQNGSGKTTLLRAIAGEGGGGGACERGARVLEGREGRTARPAPAARAGPVARGVRPLRRAGARR